MRVSEYISFYAGQYIKVVVPLLVGLLTVLILVAIIYYTRPKPGVCDMPMLLVSHFAMLSASL